MPAYSLRVNGKTRSVSVEASMPEVWQTIRVETWVN